MRLTGKRHPYSSDFRLGLDADGRILAYEVTFYQNAGAAADLSPAILERTLFHATGSYFVPNVRATGLSCRTNLPPFTAFRGFGAPQAMFVIECGHRPGRRGARRRRPSPAAPEPARARATSFPYGMRVERCRARALLGRGGGPVPTSTSRAPGGASTTAPRVSPSAAWR